MPNILPRSGTHGGVSIQADTLDVDLNAEAMAREAAEVVAQAHREAIPAGEKADGTGSNKTPEGGRDGLLGYETGKLAASFTARTTGGKGSARAEVFARGLDPGRTKFLARNAERLIFAGEAGTPLSKAVDTVLSKTLDRQIK